MSEAPAPRSEARELSSRATPAYRLGWLVALAWAAAGVASALVGGSGPEERVTAALLGAIGVGIAALFLALFGRLRRVRLAGDILEVSSLRSTIRVPLGDVERVWGTRFSNPERIFLDLRTPSPLGQRITFIPPLRWLRGFSAHPLVAELAARADAYRPTAPPAPIAPPRSGFGRVARNAVLLALAIAAFVAVGEYSMRASPAYQAALAKARASRELAAAIGEPMREGWLIDGSIRTRGETGTARLEFDLEGPRGVAKLHAEMQKSGGAWSAVALRARVPGRPGAIDLAPPAAP